MVHLSGYTYAICKETYPMAKRNNKKVLEKWSNLSEDNQVKIVLVIIAAFLAGFGYLIKVYLIDHEPTKQLPSDQQAPMMILSGADFIEGDIHIINFKPPNTIFNATLKNTGDKLLEFEETSFPDEFFYLTLWDSNLNIPAHSKLDFRIIFKNSIPDRVEYPFSLSFNNQHDKVKMRIRITGNWHAYLQSKLDDFKKIITANTSPHQRYLLAKEVLAQNNKDLDEGLKEALIGNFLSQAKQSEAAAIAYKNAEKLNKNLVNHFVYNPQIVNELAKLHKKNGDYKKAEKWYKIAAHQGDPAALNNLSKLSLNKTNQTNSEIYKSSSSNKLQQRMISPILPKEKTPYSAAISFLLNNGNCSLCNLENVAIKEAILDTNDPNNLVFLKQDIEKIFIVVIPATEYIEKHYYLAKWQKTLETNNYFLLVETETNSGYTEIELEETDLEGARLEGADLEGAKLRWAKLRGADLRGAYLRGADLEGADLEGADLRGADLEGAKLMEAKLEGAKLRWAKLRGADLRGADLSVADLSVADLEGAKLMEAKLMEAKLRWAKLRGADLRGADLRGAKLEGADLEGADLEGADLEGADLEGAKLEGAKLEGANLNLTIR